MKLKKSVKLPQEQFITGKKQEKSNVLKQKEDKEDSLNQKFFLSSGEEIPRNLLPKKSVEKSVIVEYQQDRKKKIWNDKYSSSKQMNCIEITKLLKIMDQDLIQKEKDLIPFWTKQSKEISKKLLLPTKIDSVDLILKSSSESLKTSQMGESWFSIKMLHHLKKKSLMTSFQSSQYILPESMDSVATPLKRKFKNPVQNLKTLKIRIFPTQIEKEKLKLMFNQQRWYYNAMVNLYKLKVLEDNKKIYTSYYALRKLLKKFDYVEEEINNIIFTDFVYNPNKNSFPIPEWWNNKEKKPFERLIRGAIFKFTSNLKSCITNLKNKNIKFFNLNFKTKKSLTDFLHFEDKEFPSFIKNIKSRYWFTDKHNKKVNIPFSDIFKEHPRGIEIIYDKATKKYYIHFPVPIDYFPSEDRRNENQASSTIEENMGDHGTIALDPGIRKFFVGYDPNGKSLIFGEGALLKLKELFLKIDSSSKRKTKLKLFTKVKNLILELHNKSANYLSSNYSHILLPDFKTSGMVSRKKKLSRLARRLMNCFSFYKFKEKLTFKCFEKNKKLYIVDESYTSKTCGICGVLNDVRGSEIYECKKCNYIIDRDLNGARNILIKNLILRSG